MLSGGVPALGAAGNLSGRLVTLNAAATAYERPAFDAPAVAEFGAGSPVLILGEADGWYITFYQGRLAYIPGESAAAPAAGENGSGPVNAAGESENGEQEAAAPAVTGETGTAGWPGDVGNVSEAAAGFGETVPNRTAETGTEAGPESAWETEAVTSAEAGLFAERGPVDTEALDQEMKQAQEDGAAWIESLEEERRGLTGSNIWRTAAVALILALFFMGIVSGLRKNEIGRKKRRKKKTEGRRHPKKDPREKGSGGESHA